ncbi:hypothetical protein FKM82_006876 [Ascaphus truei]
MLAMIRWRLLVWTIWSCFACPLWLAAQPMSLMTPVSRARLLVILVCRMINSYQLLLITSSFCSLQCLPTGAGGGTGVAAVEKAGGGTAVAVERAVN